MSRLQPEDQDTTVKPLLTEETILSGEALVDKVDIQEPMLQRKLGGCCCDCCHSHGCNFGRKFPSPPNVNQCLTPQMFNSLCRLCYKVSGPAIDALTSQAA